MSLKDILSPKEDKGPQLTRGDHKRRGNKVKDQLYKYYLAGKRPADVCEKLKLSRPAVNSYFSAISTIDCLIGKEGATHEAIAASKDRNIPYWLDYFLSVGIYAWDESAKKYVRGENYKKRKK